MSLSYENVQAEFGNFLNEMVEQQDLKENFDQNIIIMQTYCKSHPEYIFETSGLSGSGFTFALPCAIVEQGSTEILNYLENDFIDQIYYQTYDCEFWDCFDKTNSPLFLISEKAKNYWSSKFYFALLISLVSIILALLLINKKTNAFIITGILLVLAGLPLVKLEWLLSFTQNKSVLGLLIIFFSESYTVFVISLVVGVCFLALGILLKIFKIGFKISDILSKFTKKSKEKKILKVEPMKKENKKKDMIKYIKKGEKELPKNLKKKRSK